MRRPATHVTIEGRQWIVTRADGEEVVSRHDTKAAAVATARELLSE